MNDHIVPDIITHGLDVVFCGTALGFRSAADKAYYAHPGNKFWLALYKFGFTPYLVKPKEYTCVLAWNIGLTDVCKTHHGNDKDILNEQYDAQRLQQEILKYQPRFLAFTSKKAAQMYLGLKSTTHIAYGLLPQKTGVTRLFVLPSPSGHASKYWIDEPWEDLYRLIRHHV